MPTAGGACPGEQGGRRSGGRGRQDWGVGWGWRGRERSRGSKGCLFPQIYLSWKSGPGEVKHWKDMIARPRQAVAQWHQLKA